MSAARITVALFGPHGRGAFNEAGLTGALRARERGHEVEIRWVGPGTPEGRTESLRDLCRRGVDLLVAHGGQGDAPVRDLHAEFPDTTFVVTQGHCTASNVACYEVLQEQSAFLAGVLAGLHSRTGVVGHLSGEMLRTGLKARAAFAQGLRSCGRPVRLLTHFCGEQHDPALAYACTLSMQREGADLVFAMLDGGRAGVNQACQERPIRQIGSVLDWVEREPDIFVAAAVADSGRCVTEAINDFATGRLRPGTSRQFGLEDSSCVRLVLAPALRVIHGRAMDAWQRRLLDGTLTVDTGFEGSRPAPLDLASAA
ncbi:MAG TPA: BMP family protein [Hydrogenophaga sp.]|uniref:BMP family protein n=1 Tax=Hydrogenophaga sp. TaxID=1904254 RepID=UPI002D174B7E|nr:BMP family protein [Hydrogenophaga sp.]HMN94264.1 BMP family protein [Hydrogenophaga sp.]HMP11024.1 BMP family protein [Hydrogenophaga sp.]